MIEQLQDRQKKMLAFILEVRQRVAGLATAREQHDTVEWIDAAMKEFEGE